jgi:hypothetical protein
VAAYSEWYHEQRARIGQPVAPALEAEAWAELRHRAAAGEAHVDAEGTLRAEGAFRGDERRGLAALALHGEPLGFTWHDVDFIRAAVLADDMHSPDDWFILQRLADRIAALLPPRSAGDGAGG